MVAEEYRRLHEEVAAYRSAAFADNTKKTYRCHLNAYLTFCNNMAVPPVPASHTLISMYAAYLARRLKARSVRQYINVVRLLHLESGYDNPCAGNWQLQSTLKGIERTLGLSVTRKTPIHPSFLIQIQKTLRWNSVLDCNFWAAALVMFFGMFRKSNLFPSSDALFTPDKQFTRSDFILQTNHVSVEVKYSKTIQCKERKFTVKFPLLQSTLCPVTALLRAFCLTRLPPDAPAFISGPEGTPMSGVVFTKRLKEPVAQCGVDPRRYASHSFRRGSATWALACGVPGELVKSMGDWKSAVYLDYLDDLPESVWNSYMHQFSTPLPK